MTTDKQISEIQSEADMKLPLTTALNALRDHHGRFFYNDEMFSHFTDWENERDRGSLPGEYDLVQKIQTEHTHEFAMVDDTIGLIKIVGVGSDKDITTEGQFIRGEIESLARTGAERWIVDLRYNTGGNMYPMLAGLGALLCDGGVGGEADSDDTERVKWSMEAGNFVYGGATYVDLPQSGSIQCDADVAVLLSRYTSSSGEVVATVFKGRPNTRFFGERSSGYTTVTNWEPISDDMTMSVSVSYYRDRDGVTYSKTIQPDVEIESPLELPLADDKVVSAAKDWLIKQ